MGRHHHARPHGGIGPALLALLVGLAGGPAFAQDAGVSAWGEPQQPSAYGPCAHVRTDAGAPQRRVRIERVEINGQTVADLAQPIARAVVACQGKALSVGDMIDLRDHITRLYLDAGYVNSGAVIADQDVSDGVLFLEVIEGVLSDIRIYRVERGRDGVAGEPQEGLRRLRDSYVRKRVRPKADEVLNAADLRARFQRLVSDDNIRRMDAALEPGDVRGEAVLNLRVEEAPRYGVFASVASERSPSVGGERASVGAVVRNTLGMGDVLGVEAGVTEGLVDAIASYALPLTARDLTLRINASYSDAEVVEQPLNDLDILSEAYAVSVGLSRPVWRGVQSDVILGADIVRKRTETELLDVPFSFSPGAVDGVTELTILRTTQDFVTESERQVLGLRSTVSVGLDALDSPTAPPNSPPQNFIAWLAQMQFARKMGPGQIISRVDAQYTPETLFSTERFAFGGINSVRGYRTNQVLADSGVVGSLEYLVALRDGAPGGGRWINRLAVSAFADGGHGWNAELDDPVVDTLASVGLQLQFSVNGRLDATIYGAAQLEDIPDPVDETIQDSGFGFRLTTRWP